MRIDVGWDAARDVCSVHDALRAVSHSRNDGWCGQRNDL